MPSMKSALILLPFAALATSKPMPHNLGLEARQQQAEGTPLFLNSPFCNFFQCAVTWKAGDQAVVNWLNAPDGDVQVDLMTNASSQLAYNVAKAPAVSNSCDAGQGYGVAVPGTTCGGFVFTVPSSWNNGNYTMRATSVQNPAIESYTDVILIQNPPNPSDVPFAVVSGTVEPASGSAAPTASASSSSAAPSGTPTGASSSGSASSSSSSGSSTGSQAAASPTASNNTNSASGLVKSSVLLSCSALALGLALSI